MSEPILPRGRGGLGKNPTRARDFNRRIIIDLLRQHGTLGRKELSEATQLSGPAVANILDELMGEGLVLDLGRKSTQGRGQPPLLFRLNAQGAYTLGFEVGVNGISMTRLDLGGTAVEQVMLAPSAMSYAESLPLLRAEIARSLTLGAGALTGIGMVMPAPVIEGRGDPTSLQGWEGVGAERLSHDLGQPVWLENDANAAALAEALFGVAAQLSDVAVIYFGAGVGLGSLQGRRLMRGARGNAGELGHVVVDPQGRPCSCGQSGCFERYVSRYALSEALGRPLQRGQVQEIWQARDPRLLAWVEEAAQHLSRIVGMVENLFDPETIILTGQLPLTVLQAINDALVLPPSVANRAERHLPRVQCGNAGGFTASIGAAALPFYEALLPETSTT